MFCSQDESLYSPTVTVLYWDSGSWPSVEVLFLVPFVVVAVIPDIAVSPILTVSVVPFLWNNVSLIMYGASTCTTANVNNNHNLKLENRLHKQWMCKKNSNSARFGGCMHYPAQEAKDRKSWETSKNYKWIIYIKGKGLRVCQLHCCLQLSLASIYKRASQSSLKKILQIKYDNHISQLKSTVICTQFMSNIQYIWLKH